MSSTLQSNSIKISKIPFSTLTHLLKIFIQSQPSIFNQTGLTRPKRTSFNHIPNDLLLPHRTPSLSVSLLFIPDLSFVDKRGEEGRLRFAFFYGSLECLRWLPKARDFTQSPQARDPVGSHWCSCSSQEQQKQQTLSDPESPLRAY